MRIRTFTELSQIPTFEERFEYLKLSGRVGADTFGFERYRNQQFYRSAEWRSIRHHVIARDLGCDLGVEGFEIPERAYIHHMNPMTIQDFKLGSDDILNPEYLITTTHRTHNAIHYGDERNLLLAPVERRPGDTKLW